MDVSKLIEWVKLKPRYLFTVAFATGIVLFAPGEIIKRLGAANFVAEHRGWVGLVFIVSFAAWFSYGIAYVGEVALARLREQLMLRTGRTYLKTLSPPEKEILRKFIDGDTKTILLDITSGVHAGLEFNKVIYHPSSVSRAFTQFDFNIQPWAWGYLRKHRDLIEVTVR